MGGLLDAEPEPVIIGLRKGRFQQKRLGAGRGRFNRKVLASRAPPGV
jgi:hypothetical protein